VASLSSPEATNLNFVPTSHTDAETEAGADIDATGSITWVLVVSDANASPRPLAF
jgi:hypothetical protein